MKRDDPELDRLQELLSLRCDGLMDQQSEDELIALMKSRPELIRDYCSFVATESVLRDPDTQRRLQEVGGEGEKATGPRKTPPRQKTKMPSRERASQPKGGLRSEHPPVARNRSNPTRRAHLYSHALDWGGKHGIAISALAASLVVCLLGWYFFAPLPATIVAVEEPVWADGKLRDVGAKLGDEWLELESGSVQLAFRSGAKTTVRGPARFQAATGMLGKLQHGYISVWTPEEAKGFQWNTPTARVIDVGTAFQLSSPAGGDTTVHVTRGAVRLEATESDAAVVLSAGQVGRSEDATKPVLLDESGLDVKTSGGIVFHAEHPTRIGKSMFDHDDQICLFLERQAVVLPYDVRVDFHQPGEYASWQDRPAVLPAGTVVDSYLAHFSPRSRRKIISGSVKFPGKILGVVSDGDRLSAGTAVLGPGWTLQCLHPERGLESALNYNSDVVAISPDRRTLSLRLRTESIDQVRILVAR